MRGFLASCMRPVLAIAALASLSAPLSSPLDIRTFTAGQTVWICDGGRFFVWRGDARTLGGRALSDSLANDSIVDIAESEGTLWVLARSGVASIDMSTGTVERIAPPVKDVHRTRIAADMDYVWLLAPDSLCRYDKLGREWFAFALPKGDSAVVGAFSDGDVVYCITGSAVRQFSILEEKWTVAPMPGFSIAPTARFYVNGASLLVVDESRIFRYVVESQSWDKIDARNPVIDISFQPSRFFYLTSAGAYQYKTDASVAEVLDIPGASGARCIASAGDTVMLATPRTMVKYSLTSKTSDNLDYSQRMRTDVLSKAFPLGSMLTVLTPEQLAVYDPGARVWEEFPLSASRAKRKVASWDDQEGLKVRYGPSVSSQLRGTVSQDIKMSYANNDSAFAIDTVVTSRVIDTTIYGVPFLDTTIYDTTSDSTFGKPFYWGNTLPVIDLTLHTTFPKDRYLDLRFDNSNVSRPPEKYLYYRGNQRDRLAWLRAGTNTFEVPQSLTLPSARFEGGAVAVESKSTLRERDRKVVRTQAGAGFITAQTRFEVLPYSEEGIYQIVAFAGDTSKNVAIVPGSIRITIDGEEVDSANYIFSSVTGDVRFLREDIIDPTSVIRVSYELQTVPENIPRDVEFVPQDHFGDLEYATASVSPREWITTEAGYLTVYRDTTRRHIAHVAVPLEFRKAKPDLFLRVNPEFSYEATAPSYAGGLSLQGRIFKNTSLLFNGLIADSSYVAGDNLSRGYGYVKHETDFTLAHNVLPEIPLSYYQHDRYYGNGEEHRYEARAGAHFVRLPFLDVALSRNIVDTIAHDPVYVIDTSMVPNDTTPDPLDSLFHFDTTGVLDSVTPFRRLKDKMQIRLYETTSPFLETVLHLNKVNYDLSYTLFGAEREDDSTRGTGHIWYGRLTLCPLSSIALTGQTLIRKNPAGSLFDLQYDPSVLLQTFNAPPGVDFTAGYGLRYGTRDSTDTASLYLERSLGLVLRPGAWVKWLSLISPRIGVMQTVTCEFDTSDPDGGEILLGNGHGADRLLSPYVGVRVFPTTDITFQNNNKWTLGDSTSHFGTFNDLKWYFGAQRLWQTRWEYDQEPRGGSIGQTIPRHYHRTWSRFENAWAPWLKTTTGIAANYKDLDSMYQDTILDTILGGWRYPTVTETSRITRFGPEVGVNLSFQKIAFIKKLLNNHTVSLYWQRSHGRMEPSPEIAYSLFLKAVFAPNLSLNTNNTFAWKRGSLDQYGGTVSLALLF